MSAEIGHFALILAAFLALLQAVLPLWGAQRGDAVLMRTGPTLALGQLGFVALAFACLMQAYLVSDFSVLNVALNSHSQKPLLYKITGVWGNHEGSLLLWVLILALFGAAVGVFGRNLPEGLRARVLSVQAMIGLGFFGFILLTSNPFARLANPPLDGQGLNPLLQDPGLAFHPPLLYLGYVGFSIAFAFAVAALIEGKVDAAWARWVRPWTLAAWGFLTGGIALGSWWAYYELGWGGWWFWDPVENASLMPWLAGTALLHSAIVVEKRDVLKSWTVLLAICTFGLSLLGTFLVRSGVITSVHAFATDPERGLYILAFLIASLGGALALYALRAAQLRPTGTFKLISRESALVLNNLILIVATLVVLGGTLYPLFASQLFATQLSVGAPFFNFMTQVLMPALLVIMAAGPLLAWKRADMAITLRRLVIPFWVTAALVILTAVLAGMEFLTLLGIGLGVWIIMGAKVDIWGRIALGKVSLGQSLRRAAGLPRGAWGTALGHGGLGLAIIGMTASGAWESEYLGRMAVGDQRQVGEFTFILVKAGPDQGPNYAARYGVFDVEFDSATIATLRAETRTYPTPPMETTEAGIFPLIIGDLFAVIEEPDAQGRWGVRLHFRPLISWIWVGAGIMMLGSFISLTDRRHRVGAPKAAKSKRGETPSPQPAE